MYVHYLPRAESSFLVRQVLLLFPLSFPKIQSTNVSGWIKIHNIKPEKKSKFLKYIPLLRDKESTSSIVILCLRSSEHLE